MGKLVHESSAVVDNPLYAVSMKLTLVDQLAARIDRQEFAGLKTIVMIFYDVCYSFHNTIIIAHKAHFVNTWAGLMACIPP